MTSQGAQILAATGWWKDLPPVSIVAVQLFEERLLMPFGEFQLAVDKALGRPVFTHELGSNVHAIRAEFRKRHGGASDDDD